MKLYLSSYMIGHHADRLIAMAGGRDARMAIIANALDFIPLEDRLAYTRTQFDPIAHFAKHGFDPSLLDLRFYFGRPQALRDVLRRQRVVWALGGNAFLLRRAMRESGFDTIVGELLSGGMVYSGWSAGTCVAGSSLRAIGLMDDPGQTAPGYPDAEPIWEGLGLVPFTIVPHHRSEHPEADAAERAVEWAQAQGLQHRALRDGEVVVKDGAEVHVLSRGTA